MNKEQFSIIKKFFNGKCSEIEGDLSNCQLLFNQYRHELDRSCGCIHTSIRKKWSEYLVKKIK